MATASREQWSSKTGFIMAAVGSAVGLGNMWRFSYLTAEKGGAAFVALYIAFTLAVALPILLAELALGRGARKSPVLALAHFGGPRWKWLGSVFVAAGFLIASYYGVIAGWTVRYALETVFVGPPADAGAHFGDVSGGWDALGFHVLFMAATLGIVAGGVSRGIERVSTIAMPLLFALVVGISLYASTLDGASAGYEYYLNADFANAMSIDVLISAAGQSFFSLSVGMGVMVTFASYLPRESHLPAEGSIIAAADFGVAFIAGLMVFPLIFALGLSEDVGESTLGALFVAMPKAFASMGLAGRIVGFGFFLALVVGALTSAISLVEVVIATAIDDFGWSRSKAALLLGGAMTLVGVPSAFNLEVLDVLDQVANNILLLGGGFGLAIFVGWVMPDPIGEAGISMERPSWLVPWHQLLRYVVPAILAFVLWHSVPSTVAAVWSLLTGG